LNIETNQYLRTDIDKNSTAANGYGCFIKVNNTNELVAIYGYDTTVFFFFKKSYRIDDASLIALQKDGLFKSRFILFKDHKKEIDIKYSSIDPEGDIFVDMVNWLNIKPRENLLRKLNKSFIIFSETDPIKRKELAMDDWSQS